MTCNAGAVRKLLAASAGLLCLAGLGAPVAWAAPYIYNGDGSEVTDERTGLVWRRCAEGMVWSGVTCSGSATLFTHEQALLHAKTQAGWRLPGIKELSSIADRSRTGPAIDLAVFPATGNFFWSASPYVGNPASAWGVYFNYGGADHYYRSGVFSVRLVRAGL